jgi:hypothetical protein
MGASPSSETPVPAAPAKQSYYTFCIRQIENSITEKQLRAWLESLSNSTSETQSNIWVLSLASHNQGKTATVMFIDVPQAFKPCKSGNLELKAPYQEDEVLVDYDFYGMRRLHIGVEPGIEYVDTFHT